MKTSLQHANDNDFLEFVLLFNHDLAELKKMPEEIVVRSNFTSISFMAAMAYGPPPVYPDCDDLLVFSTSEIKEASGFAYVLCRVPWKKKFESLEIGYRPKGADKNVFITITGPLPADFSTIAYVPASSKAAALPKSVSFPTCHSGRGKWSVAHAFAKPASYPLIYLWRGEIPGHFEMHSHVMSNHCAPLPGIWEKSGVTTFLEPSYDTQDYLAGWWFVMGEAGDIGKQSTPAIGDAFASQMAAGNFKSIFPFLSDSHTASATLMPMDMEYMHFLGYFGIPITRREYKKTWYCWNKKWKRFTNNVPQVISTMPPMGMGMGMPIGMGMGTVTIPVDSPTPSSSHQETWCYMSSQDAKAYVPWSVQLQDHAEVWTRSRGNSKIASMPFFHFEPRRHVNTSVFPTEKSRLELSMMFAVQSQTWNRSSKFFGYKLYTAMGWAPNDPYLKSVLKPFYDQCEAADIPILNHCTPVGFYSHDRKFYHELLTEQNMIKAAPVLDADGWPDSFPFSVPGPDGKFLVDKQGNRRAPETGPESNWWFTQNYVSPNAWKPVVERHKKLRLCLAHFGDSAHLDSDGWGERKVREPKSTRHELTIQFNGAKIDRANSHWFLADLIDLVQPDNRVFIDLSYVMLNSRNAAKFQELFDWARKNKPVLLERVMWGTDWPLLGNESMVKNYKWTKENILHRYARAFKEQIPQMPADFFVRVCFLNPIQYIGLKKVASLVGGGAWPWLGDIPDAIFTDFQGDKLECLYKNDKKIKTKMS
ncbi:MAG TPA: amidohydrolase family protein [Fibrobacteria bacterium]|nr:amidohydrolase family protein [Fibrobacteria bacterium]